MTRYVALLRGVNVGGRNMLPMPQLKLLVESLGHEEVSTYIQSGNVVFTANRTVTAAAIESAVSKRFGLDVSVVIRSGAQLRKVLLSNPFTGDPKTVHVAFLGRPARAVEAGTLDDSQFAPERFVVKGADVYLQLPNGMARTKVPAYLERQLKIPMTIRNMNTVARLAGLAGG